MDANREETLFFVLLDFSATLSRAQHYKAKGGEKGPNEILQVIWIHLKGMQFSFKLPLWTFNMDADVNSVHWKYSTNHVCKSDNISTVTALLIGWYQLNHKDNLFEINPG